MSNYHYTDGLVSERLKTRWLKEDDIRNMIPFFDDPVAMKYLGDYGLPTALQRSEMIVRRQMERYEKKIYGLQAILDKTNDQLLGLCGLLRQTVDGVEETEVGYHFLREHWGKGYAPEAAKLFLDFAFRHEQSDSVISIIHVENLNSQRVAEKNGLAIEKETSWMVYDRVYIYRITKEKFRN